MSNRAGGEVTSCAFSVFSIFPGKFLKSSGFGDVVRSWRGGSLCGAMEGLCGSTRWRSSSRGEGLLLPARSHGASELSFCVGLAKSSVCRKIAKLFLFFCSFPFMDVPLYLDRGLKNFPFLCCPCVAVGSFDKSGTESEPSAFWSSLQNPLSCHERWAEGMLSYFSSLACFSLIEENGALKTSSSDSCF